MKRIFSILLLLFVVALVAALSFLFFFKFEGTPPEIKKFVLREPLGKKSKLILEVSDQRSGIRAIKIYLLQKQHRAALFEKQYPVDLLWGSRVKEEHLEITFEPLKLGFRSGKAKLLLEISDGAWRNGLKGNLLAVEKEVLLDLDSPRIVIHSPIHYLSPGGSNLVVYSISEKVRRHGVVLNERFFEGYELPGADRLYFALVALPIQERDITKMFVEAEDLAGNKARLPVAYYVRKKKYRHDVINITDSFLKRKIPEFWERYPDVPQGDLLKAFIYINTEMRQKNNATISKLTRRSQIKAFYGDQALLRLPKSATRALFGDHRTYYYKRREIGRAIHLGIDLASVARAPVPAAAEGKVVFADYLGIYGNTIILDHGLGLFTLYAHLAGFTVSLGDSVKRGQLIAYTDTTGLAGGDHLHFAVLVQGVFVEPVEWFDPHWVKTRIKSKLPVPGKAPKS
ncbi:MAG: M23 family metallopeptidase [Thermodesulfobacteria bacterium]|nr:M23 family metallopeptidase [Thermodesulfobacteriota bacterium]